MIIKTRILIKMLWVVVKLSPAFLFFFTVTDCPVLNTTFLMSISEIKTDCAKDVNVYLNLSTRKSFSVPPSGIMWQHTYRCPTQCLNVLVYLLVGKSFLKAVCTISVGEELQQLLRLIFKATSTSTETFIIGPHHSVMSQKALFILVSQHRGIIAPFRLTYFFIISLTTVNVFSPHNIEILHGATVIVVYPAASIIVKSTVTQSAPTITTYMATIIVTWSGPVITA